MRDVVSRRETQFPQRTPCCADKLISKSKIERNCCRADNKSERPKPTNGGFLANIASLLVFVRQQPFCFTMQM